jgi:hypothetical protein
MANTTSGGVCFAVELCPVALNRIRFVVVVVVVVVVIVEMKSHG